MDATLFLYGIGGVVLLMSLSLTMMVLSTRRPAREAAPATVKADNTSQPLP